MKKYKSFEEFLEEMCEDEGGYEGVLDDDYSDAFDRWLDGKDVGDMLVYGETLVDLMKKNE